MKSSFILPACLLAAGFLAVSARAEDKRYTLTDLQALQKREAWDELAAHLQDIPPAQRDASWNRLVESACVRPGKLDHYRAEILAEGCMEPLRGVLKSEPQNRDFAWSAGKWIRRNAGSVEAVPFFAQAGLKSADPRCSDADLQTAVVAGLGLPRESQGAIVRQSQDLAFKTCWPAMEERVLAAYNEGGHAEQNACKGLKEKGQLGSLASKRCTDK